MATYFTADLHLGHKNILQYTKRPYSSVEDMGEAYVKEWQATITGQDTVWVIGDFCFGGRDVTESYFRRLPGNKHLVVGNHDSKHVLKQPWGSIHEIYNACFDGQWIVLCHYPMMTWNQAHHGSYHLHGHSHGQLRSPETTRMDVGVDATGKLFVTLDEVMATLSQRKYIAQDHHGK